ncbi:DUF2231 domain-containing protein [Lutibaculum baratangense]|uniref:DUF2231 domain-containing protein n=1 Tax=Lutibaculum baratangense AMV1 TaxID=631454 RepID=V4RAQ5_9HYPH|nr:DUF2231 domain-containing protein [Lutibaculum baratangense]ESR23261.1 hypothetical protein N177_3329 [Lutibaculum baratangense AMV1]
MEIFKETTSKGTGTKIALLEHPLHPMTVTFPIAFVISLLPSDIAYLYLGDPFWARVSLWLAGAGAFSAMIAGVVGTGELLSVSAIRRRAAAWNHFVAAVVMISVVWANWVMRLPDHEAAIYPWGIALSALGALLVALAGWLGGDLVFEHLVGTGEETEEEEEADAEAAEQRA